MCDKNVGQAKEAKAQTHEGWKRRVHRVKEEANLPRDPRWAQQQVWKVGIRMGNENMKIK